MPAPYLSQEEFTSELADFCHRVATRWYEEGRPGWTSEGEPEPHDPPMVAVAS